MTLPNIVLVTGATSGFGAAIANRFAAAGSRVIATGRRTERLQPLVDAHPDRILPLGFDVRDRQGVTDAIEGLPAAFADIDLLVNNAGLALGLDSAESASLDDWDAMVDTNIKGLAYCTRAVLPGMVARGRGHIVNIGSIAGDYPYPSGNMYGGTKAFVWQFTRNLRCDLVDKNIRVTDVAPGAAETEFSVVRFKGDENAAAKVYDGFKPLTPEDVAESVYWAATLPPHVNINMIELMPTSQSAGALRFHREKA